MTKLFLSAFLVAITCGAFGQDIAANNYFPGGFTSNHKSLSVTYGVSTILGAAPFIQGSTASSTDGSLTLGPVEILYNRGLNDNFSLHVGGTLMYHKDQYLYDGGRNGHSNLYFGGVIAGAGYHFMGNARIDPYLKATTGIGHFYGRGGADQLGMRKKGLTTILYGANLGVNLYTRNQNAWILEAGYDYLAYFKVGYTFVKQR